MRNARPRHRLRECCRAAVEARVRVPAPAEWASAELAEDPVRPHPETNRHPPHHRHRRSMRAPRQPRRSPRESRPRFREFRRVPAPDLPVRRGRRRAPDPGTALADGIALTDRMQCNAASRRRGMRARAYSSSRHGSSVARSQQRRQCIRKNFNCGLSTPHAPLIRARQVILEVRVLLRSSSVHCESDLDGRVGLRHHRNQYF